MMAVETIALGHSYGSQRALDNLSIRVPVGQACGILGSNGAGKSTLLGILSTRILPTEGVGRILGLDVGRDFSGIRGSIGVVHGDNLRAEPGWSVMRYLMYIGRCYGLARRDAQARAHYCLQATGFDDDPSRVIGHLSGGNARKVEIARALLHEPEILLLDEPTRELDLRARQSVWIHLRELAKSGTTILLASHDPLEIARVCDRVVVLRAGRIGWQGRIEAFGPDPADALAEALDGRYPLRPPADLHPAR